jgi:predicted nucleic acid-binding protein
MIFDTDVLIWVQRANKKAANLINKTDERKISIQTYMELMQCPQSKRQQQIVGSFLSDYAFEILPFTENIGHRASIYIEEYSLAIGIRTGDAIIAATAIENNLILATSNKKHFKNIKDLRISHFVP